MGEENYQGLKHLKGPEKLSQAAEQFKERPAEPTIMNLGKVIDHGDRYAGSVNARQRGQEFDALPKAELVSRAEAIVADWQPSQAGLYLRLYEAWTLSTEDMADLAAAPLQRTPAVFADDLLERARMAVFHDPALGPDAFKSTTLAYQKPTGGANANAADFARSEEQAGLLDPTRATVAAGVDLVSADHVRNLGLSHGGDGAQRGRDRGDPSLRSGPRIGRHRDGHGAHGHRRLAHAEHRRVT